MLLQKFTNFNMRVLLLFPTIFEAEAFFKKAGKRASLGEVASLKVNEVEFQGYIVGIGCKVSQDRLKAFLENKNFDFVMLCGFCGACSSELKEGDIVFETQNETLNEILKSFGLSGKIACEKEVAGFDRKIELFRQGFCAVDMEADFFKPLFDAEKFVHLRAVSDDINSKIPAEFFTSLMDFETGSSSFSVSKFFKLVLKNPTLPFILIDFARSANKAKNIYETKLFAIIEKLSDFYLQKQNINKIL